MGFIILLVRFYHVGFTGFMAHNLSMGFIYLGSLERVGLQAHDGSLLDYGFQLPNDSLFAYGF